MGKYWAVFKITWQNSLEYRVEFLTHMIRGIITLVILIFIWSAIFKQTPNFGNYTFSSMLTYLVMVQFLHFATRGNIGRLTADEIKEGKLSIYLLKPISYLKMWFSSFWADRFFEFFIRFLIIFTFLFLLPNYFKLPLPGRFFLFLLFLVISLLFNFLWNIFQATFAFWVTDIHLFTTTLGLTVGFLAGELIPIDIMPNFLKTLSLFLPFQYTLYFPIKIYQGALSGGEIVRGVFVFLSWIAVLYFLMTHLWQRGLRRYEAIGQ